MHASTSSTRRTTCKYVHGSKIKPVASNKMNLKRGKNRREGKIYFQKLICKNNFVRILNLTKKEHNKEIISIRFSSILVKKEKTLDITC